MSLYHEAADILSTSSQEGGSLKSRVFRRKNIKSTPTQLYALVFESCKWSPILKEVIEGLTPTLALLLVHDLLLAKGGIALPQSHGLRASIEKYKGRISSEFTRARLRRKAPSLQALKAQVEKAAAGEEAAHPRWVRINALKSTLEEQLDTTFRNYSRARTIQDVVTKEGKQLLIDAHVPNLVAITPGCDLSKTEAYISGKIILQDKASCFPAYLLDPRSEDGDVIDACAAPGNKTTHLASIIHSHQPEFESESQTIFAFEKDSRRAQTLEKMVKIAGSKKMTRIALGQDFLQVDPQSEKFKNVGALLLDPSCSGSGIVGRDSMPELHLPGQPQPNSGRGSKADSTNKRKRKHEEVGESNQTVIRDDDGNETVMKSEKDLTERLDALAGFQLAILLHAFQFPSAKKVTYSTCSIHSQENEHVVMAALNSDIGKEKGWRIVQRNDQVRGMKDWPVRGLVAACNGDEAVAQGCIRSYKDDGHGIMGFFVAGFVRDVTNGNEAGDGPYIRDESGVIIRDLLGMPMLKSTGAVVPLVSRDDVGQDTSSTDSHKSVEDDGTDTEESEWEGLED
ncbi:NOL1/NOP2/Sun domain family [Pochonia chlamydosporia 170]|uniref:NOL1/NOP2/Sun domain family n=1 Tax=Pochonia chlamydosporia 170 TaxID=1380566 RepID=A0A179FZ81_METCM|nr:NOL1/NOP2/Sun domain family [Pochonia chlamydosporia 170]OAQ70363.1 NOL1/NOP2/Sun domain family [Pochonia chlamydosporia 170]